MDTYVEIADVIVIGGIPLSISRFFDGRVRADSLDPVTLSFADFVELKGIVSPRFKGLVKQGNPGFVGVAISHAEGNKHELKEEIFGIKMEVEIGSNVFPQKSLKATLIWDSAADTVTLTRDDPFDIFWGEWLLWVKWLEDFCDTVRLYKGGNGI